MSQDLVVQALIVLNAVWVTLGLCIIVIFGFYVADSGFDRSRARVRAAISLAVYFAGATAWHAVGIGIRSDLLSGIPSDVVASALVLSAALGLMGALCCIRIFSPMGMGARVVAASTAASIAAALAARYYLT